MIWFHQLDSTVNADYLHSECTFEFTSTAEQQCTNISIIDDDEVEATEQFNVSLVNSSPDAVSLLPSQTTVLITDNDGTYVHETTLMVRMFTKLH